MGNNTTAVKNFEANIDGQSLVDLIFDWKTSITSDNKKSGIEFRDLYGRLIFAFSGAKGSEVLYSTSGWDSVSSKAQFNLEPIWSKVAFDPTKIYTVRLVAIFNRKVVSYSIKEKDGNALVQQVNMPIQATGMAKMVVTYCYTNEQRDSDSR